MNTTPEELLEYLQKNINYRITDQCYTTPDEVRLNKVASCWSAADLQYEELTAMGYEVIILFLTKLDYDRTHAATLYTDGVRCSGFVNDNHSETDFDFLVIYNVEKDFEPGELSFSIIDEIEV